MMERFLKGFADGFFSTFDKMFANLGKMIVSGDWMFFGLLLGRMLGVLVVIFIAVCIAYILADFWRNRITSIKERISDRSEKGER